MKKVIYKYLSAFFTIKGDEILLKGTERRYYRYTLVKELIKVFNLTQKQIKWYVRDWALRENRNFDFDKYWGNINTRGLIASELVSVQPMDPPSGQLFYMDFVYQNISHALGVPADRLGRPTTGDYICGIDTANNSFDSLAITVGTRYNIESWITRAGTSLATPQSMGHRYVSDYLVN